MGMQIDDGLMMGGYNHISIMGMQVDDGFTMGGYNHLSIMGMQVDDGLMMGGYNAMTNLCLLHTCITDNWPLPTKARILCLDSL